MQAGGCRQSDLADVAPRGLYDREYRIGEFYRRSFRSHEYIQAPPLPRGVDRRFLHVMLESQMT